LRPFTVADKGQPDHPALRLKLMPRFAGSGLVFSTLLAPGLFAAERIAFVNGHILTVDGQFRVADSLVIEGERIIAVGDPAAAKTATQTIDLGGATVLPGLIELPCPRDRGLDLRV